MVMTMSDIPKAMSLLNTALRYCEDDPEDLCEAIRQALALMPRKKPGKPVARATAKKVTPAIMGEVMILFRQNPYRSNRSMGLELGIDGGRVSEIINGHRDFKTGDMK